MTKAGKITAKQLLNQLDETFGHVVQTEEREDICAALADLAAAARQPAVVQEVNEWPSW
jgi:hypothetical protein